MTDLQTVGIIAGAIVAVVTVLYGFARCVIELRDALDAIIEANAGVREVTATMRSVTRQTDRRFRAVEHRLDRLESA